MEWDKSSKPIEQFCTEFAEEQLDLHLQAAQEPDQSVHGAFALLRETATETLEQAWLDRLESLYGAERIATIIKETTVLEQELKPYYDNTAANWNEKTAYDLLPPSYYRQPLSKEIIVSFAAISEKVDFATSSATLQAIQTRLTSSHSHAERILPRDLKLVLSIAQESASPVDPSASKGPSAGQDNFVHHNLRSRKPTTYPAIAVVKRRRLNKRNKDQPVRSASREADYPSPELFRHTTFKDLSDHDDLETYSQLNSTSSPSQSLVEAQEGRDSSRPQGRNGGGEKQPDLPQRSGDNYDVDQGLRARDNTPAYDDWLPESPTLSQSRRSRTGSLSKWSGNQLVSPRNPGEVPLILRNPAKTVGDWSHAVESTVGIGCTQTVNSEDTRLDFSCKLIGTAAADEHTVSMRTQQQPQPIPPNTLEGAVSSLQDGLWLSTTAIEELLKMPSYGDVKVYDAAFMCLPNPESMKAKTSSKGWPDVVSLFPSNHNGSHWTLLVLDLHVVEIEFYNSLPNQAYELEARAAAYN